MAKRSLFLTLVVFLATFLNSYSQITIGAVDPGPYTPGSSIAAIFKIDPTSPNCIKTNNEFELYLSDANGNFVSPTPIGTYKGFYSTFVNGTIPPGIPASTNYRLRIKSTSLGTFTAATIPITIETGKPSVIAKLTSLSNIGTDPTAFGSCNTDENTPLTSFNFNNESTSDAAVVNITNEFNPTAAPDVLTFSSKGDNGSQIYNAQLAHYTMFVKSVSNGTVGTKAYFLINNLAVTAFTTTSGNTVCYPTGTFQYSVTTERESNGIALNFPGNIYQIDWGDGTSNDYTYCDIVKAGNKVIHSFSASSCDKQYTSGAQTIYNAFAVNVNLISPYCGKIGAPLSTPARVVTRPTNSFEGPLIGCLDEDITFTNKSSAGEKANINTPGCLPNTMTYSWWVDGVPIAINKQRSFLFVHAFSTNGTHTVKLTSSTTGGGCDAVEFSQNICIQNKPTAVFTLTETTICLNPGTITPSNSSVTDPTCSPDVTYTWNVSPANGVIFNANAKEPQFKFTIAGIYNIKLTVSSGACTTISTPQEIIVNALPVAQLLVQAKICNIGNLTFDPTAGITKTIISGTQNILPETYLWEVSGGSAEFVAPFTKNSQYPTIKFNEFKTYTVKLTHTNNCDVAIGTQEIVISAAPVPVINPVNQICYDATVQLDAIITGLYDSHTWSSAEGGTFTYPTPNQLAPIFTPSSSERVAGKAVVTLMVNTGIEGACKFVSTTLTVLIFKKNSGTDFPQQICSGTNTNYDPSTGSSLPGSTFKWTATNPDGNASNFNISGTGPIREQLFNSHLTEMATVIYKITPMRDDCDGLPFTFTVTINPKPAVSATVAAPTICSGKSTQITLAPTIAGTQYTWISTATDGVTGMNDQLVATSSTTINDILTNTGNAQGSVTYDITPLYNNCPGLVFSVTIKVDPAITEANAGNAENICSVSNYTLAGNSIKSGETGLWTLSSGQTGVTISNENTQNAFVEGLVAGQTYIFKWTISAPGVCLPSSNEVSIHVNKPTVSGTIAGATTVCSGNNTGQITLSGQTGTVVAWKSSIDNGLTWQIATGNNTSGTLPYQNLTRSTQYYAIVQNGSCPAANTNPIVITVAPSTTLAIAGPAQELCEATSVILKANPIAAGESGLWTYVSGPAEPTIPTPTQPEITVTGLRIGETYVFEWTITGNAPCGPSSSLVTIKSLAPITQSISNPSPIICSGQTAHIVGSAPPTGGNGSYTYVWESKTPAGTWNIIPGQTAENLDLLLTEDISIRRIVTSGICTSTSNETPITVLEQIGNNLISANQTICNEDIPALLTGELPTGADGNFIYSWQSSIDGGTTWTDLNSFGQNYQPLALTSTTSYRRIVYTTICNGAQRSTSIPVTVTVKPDAIAKFTFTEDKSCAPFVITATNVRAVEYPSINDVYQWYIDDVLVHTGITFPGTTIIESDKSVSIKLVVTPKIGCRSSTFIQVFSTRQAVPASYTQSATEGCGPLPLRFVNTSPPNGDATFLWDFGNGQTSTQFNPAPITFTSDPTGKDITYTVTLTSTTSCGSNSMSSTVFVKAKPVAVFSPSKTVGCSPMVVNFSNTSPGGTNKYYYDFGDGSPIEERTDKLPISHIYNTTVTKIFVATMTAFNECGTDIKTYNISVSPQNMTPELVVDATEKRGCAPLTVNFDNNTIGATHFTFDFGDGGTLNTTKPGREQYIFTKPGKYTITMTAFNNCSEIIETEEVEVLEQPLAAFNADITLGCAGLAVQFKNTTQDGFSYVWDFGDGTTSNEFEPKHVYNGDKEYYTVTLTATNTLGCSIAVSRNQYIHIVPPPVAAFFVNPSTLISIPDYTFKFEDESTNGPTTWAWDFGDGTTSEKQHPIHTYPDTGTYKVTLTTFNQQGCFTSTFKHVTIKGVPGYLFVPNSFIPGSEYPELRTFSAKGSGIATWKFSVFNKWAELVWETTKLDESRPAEGWDGNYKGSPAPQGVYYWKIDVKMINGTEWKGMTYDKSVPKRTGAIHLIR